MSMLYRFVDHRPVGRPARPRFFRGRGAAVGIIAIALAAGASPGSAAGHQKPAQSQEGPAPAPDLNADGSVPDKVVKAGIQTSAAIVRDCALPNYAPVVSARVEHGTIRIRTGAGPSCGLASMSLTNVLYTLDPGFKGTDKLTILAFLTSGDLTQTYTILVK
jgi:hypothetical protein